MRISRRRSFIPPPSQDKRYRINHYIKAPQLRLIDEEGENLGLVSTAQALSIAQERGLDLVEVSPLAQPPVAKIVDYSKLKYQEEKERRKERAKQKTVEVKGIRLSLRISEHDTEVRMNQAEKFLTNGDKVRVELILRGRERQHTDLAKKIIDNFVASMNKRMPVTVEQGLAVQGGKMALVIGQT